MYGSVTCVQSRTALSHEVTLTCRMAMFSWFCAHVTHHRNHAKYSSKRFVLTPRNLLMNPWKREWSVLTRLMAWSSASVRVSVTPSVYMAPG